LPSYNTVNGSLSFDLGNGLEFSAFVKNLFNTKGQLSAVALNNVFIPDAPVPVTISQPLTGGVTVKFAWGAAHPG
jgi:outer membrane receptor protein involved in Fe transport